LLRGLLLVAAAALIWIGIAFAGYAIYVALLVNLQPAWAAAITAACLLAVPYAMFMMLVVKRPRAALHAPEPRAAQAYPDKATFQLLADFAKDKPLLAVLIAGVLGAAETVRRRREL